MAFPDGIADFRSDTVTRPTPAMLAAMAGTPNKSLREIAENPRYRQLVRERSRFAWILTGIMLAICP